MLAPIANGLFSRFLGSQLQIFYPSDEGCYLQGPLLEVVVTENEHKNGYINILFKFEWLGKKEPANNPTWQLCRRLGTGLETEFTLPDMTLEDIEKLTQKTSCILPGRELVLVLFPPDSKGIIARPDDGPAQ